MDEIKEANRVDIAAIEKDLQRGGFRRARRWMAIDVIPTMQAMPGGYLCDRGPNRIAVPEDKVASVMAMAATDDDRAAMKFAAKRYAEELAKAKAKGQTEDTIGFSIPSIFREVAGHDYPALESAVLLDVDALPPEQLLSEERAQAAQARLLAGVVREAVFAQPD